MSSKIIKEEAIYVLDSKDRYIIEQNPQKKRNLEKNFETFTITHDEDYKKYKSGTLLIRGNLYSDMKKNKLYSFEDFLQEYAQDLSNLVRSVLINMGCTKLTIIGEVTKRDCEKQKKENFLTKMINKLGLSGEKKSIFKTHKLSRERKLADYKGNGIGMSIDEFQDWLSREKIKVEILPAWLRDWMEKYKRVGDLKGESWTKENQKELRSMINAETVHSIRASLKKCSLVCRKENSNCEEYEVCILDRIEVEF